MPFFSPHIFLIFFYYSSSFCPSSFILSGDVAHSHLCVLQNGSGDRLAIEKVIAFLVESHFVDLSDITDVITRWLFRLLVNTLRASSKGAPAHLLSY